MSSSSTSLRGFYFLRAAFALAWVGLVVFVAPRNAGVGFALLVLYPAWDGLANLIDARRARHLGSASEQRVNAALSFLVACAIALAAGLGRGAAAVGVFGLWAVLAGLLQLTVGIRRRQAGGQAFMMISGVQSAVAGALFIFQAFTRPPGLTQLAPYAAFGGIYFLLSAIWLTIKARRSGTLEKDAGALTRAR